MPPSSPFLVNLICYAATFRSTTRVLYEETLICHATTPLGAAIACPEQFFPISKNCPLGCGLDDDACYQVYMGHNIVGAEWHWLPYKVLQKWWRETFQPILSTEMYQTFDNFLKTLTPSNPDWCPYEGDGVARPHNKHDYRNKILNCEVPLAHAVDSYAHRLLAELQTTTTSEKQHSLGVTPAIEDWSFLYASLPVLRTTIIREPWSWLVSKVSYSC